MSHGRWRFAAALLTIAVLTAACGNSGDGGAPADEPDPAAPADPAPADDGSDERDTFVAVDAPGVTDAEIRFTSIATITQNPLGTDLGNAYNNGIEAYFAFRNDEGGIFGRDLVLSEKLDDQLAKNADQAQALVSSGDAFGAFVATLLFTGADVLEDNGVPTFGWGIHSEFSNRRNLFGHIAPICPGCPGPTIPYLAREVGATKIGVVAYNSTDNSKQCGEGQRDSVEQFKAEPGQEVVFFDNNLNFGLGTGLAPQVSAMKEAGVEFIASCLDMNGMKVLGEELHKQGMDDVVMHHSNSYDAAFVEANAELFEGDFVLPQFTPFEAEIDSEIQAAFFEWTDKTEVDRLELTMVGFLNAHLAFTGLLAAGPEFDRVKVVDAVRSIQDYSAGGMIAPIDWDRQVTDPGEDPAAGGDPDCIVAVKVEDGAFVQGSGEPGSPYVCWEPDIQEFVEPTFTSFE